MFAILNGIDTNIWNPANDPLLAEPYSVKKMAGKAKNKTALLKRARLKGSAKVLVYGTVSRLTDQKGVDFINKQKAFFSDHDVRLILLGKGDHKLEQGLKKLQKIYNYAMASSGKISIGSFSELNKYL